MASQNARRRWIISGLLLSVIGVLVLVAFLNRSIRQTLPDGTTFELVSVEVGLTNVITRGTLFTKLAAPVIPTNGWKLGRWEFKRPQTLTFHNQGRSDLLVAAIRVQADKTRQKHFRLPPADHAFRVVVVGEDGFPYVEDFVRFREFPDGVVAHVVTPRFPRDSKTLWFRVEQRPNADAAWEQLAELKIPNPKPTLALEWQPDTKRVHAISDELSVEIGSLIVPSKPIGFDTPWNDSPRLRLLFRENDEVVTNWAAYLGGSSPIRDATGNRDGHHHPPTVSNSWVEHPIHRPLNPRVPWRFEVDVAATTNYPASQLYTFTIPWPLPRAIYTNFGGVPADIMTAGRAMLRVNLLNRPAATRVSFVSAKDDKGAELRHWGGSWNQHHFQADLRAVSSKQIEATIAVHPNYRVEFTIQAELAAE